MFNITVRRKPLFYYINLLAPCVVFNILTLVVFLLPFDSGEKISLSITILAALSVFQIHLMDIMPVTSVTIPIIMRYISFTIVMVVLSVGVSILSLNFSRRSNSTHTFPLVMNVLFLRTIPRLLFMTIPFSVREYLDKYQDARKSSPSESRDGVFEEINESRADNGDTCEACMLQGKMRFPSAIRDVLDGLDYMVEQMKATEKHKRVSYWHVAIPLWLSIYSVLVTKNHVKYLEVQLWISLHCNWYVFRCIFCDPDWFFMWGLFLYLLSRNIF